MMNGIYHYVECGLPNIYLRNGYHIEVIDNEEYFSIDDIDGLHKVIAMTLVNKTTHLTGGEFKFFRIQFNHSRRVLAELLGYDQQTIGRWENGNSSIPKLADASIRKLYLESVNEDSNLGLLLEKIADMEAELEMSKIVIEEAENHWQVAEDKTIA